MFKIVQRYLAYSFIPPFVICMIFFVTFLLTFKLFKITSIVINKGVELSIIMELIGHIAVSFIPMAVPLSAFFATIFTLNKLSEDSEIIAMRSFGITKFQLFLPFLILGIAIAISVFSLNRNLIPYSTRQFKNGIIQLTSKGLLNDIKAENFFTEIPNVTLFSEKILDDGKELENVFLHLKSGNKSDEKIIFAKNGTLIKQKKDKWGMASLRLRLLNGNIIKAVTGKNGNIEMEKILFEEYDFPVFSGEYHSNYVTKNSMRTSIELLEKIKMDKEKIKKGDTDTGIVKTQLEFWSRINTPLQCLIFILLGLALGIKKGRGGSKNTGVYGMIILIAYYSILFTGISMARKGFISPAFAIFLPSILAFGVGINHYRKLDWLS